MQIVDASRWTNLLSADLLVEFQKGWIHKKMWWSFKCSQKNSNNEWFLEAKPCKKTTKCGGFNPLNNMKVSWDDYSHYMENKTCSKPPTSHFLGPNFHPHGAFAWSPPCQHRSWWATDPSTSWALHPPGQSLRYSDGSWNTGKYMNNLWIIYG